MTRHIKFIPAIAGAAAALVASACRTSPAGAQTPVHWKVAPAAAAPAGGVTHVRLIATMDPGWHIYAITQPPGGPVATRITLPQGQPFTLAGPIRVAPPPSTALDESFGIQVQMHEGKAEFLVPVKRSGTAPASTVRVDARYQACSESLCLPPQTAHLSIPVAR